MTAPGRGDRELAGSGLWAASGRKASSRTGVQLLRTSRILLGVGLLNTTRGNLPSLSRRHGGVTGNWRTAGCCVPAVVMISLEPTVSCRPGGAGYCRFEAFSGRPLIQGCARLRCLRMSRGKVSRGRWTLVVRTGCRLHRRRSHVVFIAWLRKANITRHHYLLRGRVPYLESVTSILLIADKHTFPGSRCCLPSLYTLRLRNVNVSSGSP